MILEKAKKILENPVCDNCLGRQFAQLLSGYSNVERGRIIRTFVAMSIDKEILNEDEKKIDLSNFINYKFHNLEIKLKPKQKKCSICNDIFSGLNDFIEKIIKKSKDFEFSSFLIGTKLSRNLIEKEEKLWESIGIDYCEPIKAELNREIGKMIEKRLKLSFNPKNPDVNFIVDVMRNRVTVQINPLFVYGEYQKLVRGIPQTKWPSKKYKTSVEEIIAKPFVRATGSENHSMHAMGREDIDARCLAWRPFVIEIKKPKKRKFDFKEIIKKVNKDKRIKIRGLRLSNINEVRKIKEAKLDKSYRCIIRCERPIKRDELKILSSLIGEIRQKTPTRVLHRRADRFRRRKVKRIMTKFINKREFQLTVRCEAGLYIKELVSGDNGRTRPSISELLGCNCVCKDLDVIKIHRK